MGAIDRFLKRGRIQDFSRGPIAKMLSELRKFGANGHLYIPGPGVPILGPELSGGSWATGGGLSVLNGVITGTGGTGALRLQPYAGTLTIGRQYKVSLSITTMSGGSISLPYDGTNGQVRSSVGVHEFTFIATTNDVYVYSAGFIGTATAYSVKEIISYSNTINGITAGNYLDSVGTTNASVDGNVGLVLDGAGSVGAELNPNPEYGGDWVAAGTTPPTANANDTFQGSACRSVTFPAIASGGYSVSRAEGAAFNSVLSTTYRCEYEIATSRPLVSGESIVVVFTGLNAIGTVNLNPANTAAVAFSKYVVHSVASVGGFVSLRPYAGTLLSPVTLYIRKASAKAVAGIHASQATTGYQPKLRRGIVNNYTYSHDASNAAYAKTNITVSAPGGVQKITPNVGAAQHYISKTYTAVSGNAYTKSVAAKADGFDWVWLYGSNPVAHAYFNVATGQIGNVTGGTATIAQGSDGYYVCTLSCTATGAAWAFETHSVASNGGGSTTTGDGTKGTLLKACAVFDGTLTADQILANGGIPLTTTAPASGSVGAYRLDFDGVDDRLLLGSVPFQTSDNFAIVFSGNVASLSALRSLFGAYSAAENNPRIQMYTSLTSGVLTGMIRDDAGASAISTGGSVQSGGNFIASLVKQGATMSVRLNGVAGSIGNTSSLGVATLDTCALCETKGGYSAASMAGVAVIKGTVTAAQALIFERGLNALSQYAAGRF